MTVILLYCRSEFHVVHPLSVELPPSLGIVVINWNIPMHLFLKDCELKYCPFLVCLHASQSCHTFAAAVLIQKVAV